MTKTYEGRGIDGESGEQLWSPLDLSTLVEAINHEDKAMDPEEKDRLNTRYDRLVMPAEVGTLGTVFDVDPLDVNAARWGVILPEGQPQEIEDNLQDLIQRRNGTVYRLKAGTTAAEFRDSYGQPAGDVDPKYLPYYFLIAAGPDEIDFDFQVDLDVEHAVGRLYFPDPTDYGHYASAVTKYEAAKNLAQKPLLTCFSPQIDANTTYSSKYLAGGLAYELHGREVKVNEKKTLTYAAKHDSAAEATKQTLLQHLSGAKPWPAVLFAASHGLGFKTPGHSRQVKEQGALECQDLKAHRDAGGKDIPASVLFGGLDVEEMLAVPNLVFFTFACYSAGTPLVDSFPKHHGQKEVPLAKKPFVAHLAQQMLAKGALAYVGHVDRTWGYSFILEDVGFRIETFSSTLKGILGGWTVGHAMEFFDRRYLSVNNELSNKVLPEFRKGETKHEGAPIDEKLASLWTERNDARNYVLLGDPAVRLNLAAMA